MVGRRAALLLAVAAAVMIAGCTGSGGSGSGDASGKQLDTLRIGHVPGVLTSPHYTAIEEGFYREAGFDAKMVQLPGPEIGKALLNGELEVGSSATTPANYQINAGLPIRLVAARAGYTTEQPGAFMVVRNGTGIDTIEELKGKTVCSSTAGSMGELWIQIWADRVGLEHGEDYKFTYLGDETSYLSAFASGSVDACFTDSATPADLLEMKGLGKKMWEFKRSDLITAFVAVRKEWVREKPDKLRRFLRAYAKAARYARNHPQERIQNIAKHSPYTEAQIRNFTMPPVPRDLRVNATKIKIGQRLMYKYGQIDQRNPVAPYVNNTFISNIQQDLQGIGPDG